ncbi:Metal tolerance protein [Drechslerella dactyloides]|uniref:Metal tolerance protein n=1 Tax=Drechslerella dactyloides TaxID=74499 RepID=A0AAD6J120_DREDA|nr:Metal tolerance protein [Drechslerella dactyloides]
MSDAAQQPAMSAPDSPTSAASPRGFSPPRRRATDGLLLDHHHLHIHPRDPAAHLPDFPSPRPVPPLLPSLVHRSPSFASLAAEGATANDDTLRRASRAMTSEALRSQRLVGTNNRRYQWERYRTSDEDLKKIKRRAVREYYEKLNTQIDRYLWVDQLLDSALVPRLLNSYSRIVTIPELEDEGEDDDAGQAGGSGSGSERNGSVGPNSPLRRRPSYVRKMAADEETALLDHAAWGREDGDKAEGIVKIAIYVNLVANTILLAGKVVATLLTSSLSVLASLVDSALDFLSTAIIGLTTYLIRRRDSQRYPIGRQRLEPIGVLVFAVIMIVSFTQVGVEALQRLFGKDHSLIQLTPPAITIMSLTVGIKGACYLWCRMVKSSSVQALAQDALTDVYFNTLSIFFPLLGFATGQWWLDPLGGLFLSLYVVVQWWRTSLEHIEHLSGAAASAEDRNLILYVCMRFAKSIRKITGVQAYYSGDALNVEAEILFDEDLPLRDSHDVAEALQLTIESIPFVDRAFVHTDYSRENPTTHLER